MCRLEDLEEVALVDEDHQLAVMVIHLDHVVVQQFQQVLRPHDEPFRQGHLQFLEDLAQQGRLGHAGGHQYQHRLVFRGIEVLQDDLGDQGLAAAARSGHQAQGDVVAHGQHHADAHFLVEVRLVEVGGVHRVRERVFAQIVVVQEVPGIPDDA